MIKTVFNRLESVPQASDFRAVDYHNASESCQENSALFNLLFA